MDQPSAEGAIPIFLQSVVVLNVAPCILDSHVTNAFVAGVFHITNGSTLSGGGHTLGITTMSTLKCLQAVAVSFR